MSIKILFGRLKWKSSHVHIASFHYPLILRDRGTFGILIMSNERSTFKHVITCIDMEREESEGTAAVFWPAKFEFTAASRALLAIVLEWCEDNTAVDVINTKVHIAVIKDNKHNF